ncbi:hypothetical protein HEAR1572 [Herminiimonas arsenicoxydans]|uniref:Uncharacterized protein n=1 Tax=Herminiimonas arsenicoxydans TaxID=204773 RepID=A4G5E8_HERAR|nr:hypothetical protein HEAR1572 [Herminiimonas arsenicoxydans]
MNYGTAILLNLYSMLKRRPQRQQKPMIPIVLLISKLPANERMQHLKRLDQFGGAWKIVDAAMTRLETQ